MNQIEKERDALKKDLERAALEKQLAANALKDKYETQIFAFTDGHQIV